LTTVATKLFTIDEVIRLHHWPRDHPQTFGWLSERHIRKAEHALSAARYSLECDARGEGCGSDTLRDAMDHALMAWCHAHFEIDLSIFLDLSAFYVTAPEALAERVELAMQLLRSIRERIRDHPDAVETVRDAAVSIIESARHPPARRKSPPGNMPCSYIASDVAEQLEVGSWVHTGRYRPARIVAVQRPRSILHLSYGDEEDEEFFAGVSHWRPVSPPATLKSLKEVFSAGDWVRHEQIGDVRVVEVFNTSIVLDVSGRHAKLIPDFACRTVFRIDEPPPTDSRPITERFPLGTWVLVGGRGEGIVLDAKAETIEGKPAEVLTVLRPDRDACRHKVIEPRSRRFSKGWRSEYVVWRLQRPRADFSPSWHRRARLFWLLYAGGGYEPDARLPCPCCGYPNTGQGDFNIYVFRCILCGWIDDAWSESEADDVRPLDEPCFPDGRKTNGGYSLTEARHNFVAHGHMFRPGDPAAEVMEAQATERESLRRLLDDLLETSEYGLWDDVYHLGMDIGECLEVLNGPCEH